MKEIYMQSSTQINEPPDDMLAQMRAWIEKNPLRIWRYTHGISQRMGASIIGVNLHTIQSWEQGNAWPNEENMDKIIAATDNIHMDYLWMQWNAQKPV